MTHWIEVTLKDGLSPTKLINVAHITAISSVAGATLVEYLGMMPFYVMEPYEQMVALVRETGFP